MQLLSSDLELKLKEGNKLIVQEKIVMEIMLGFSFVPKEEIKDVPISNLNVYYALIWRWSLVLLECVCIDTHWFWDGNKNEKFLYGGESIILALKKRKISCITDW